MAARDQFILERYLQGEIVHYDLPLHGANVSLELNREIVITGVLGADFIKEVNQGMGLFPYNDCIHWVHDGVLRGGALLQPLSFDEDGNVVLSALGWSTVMDVPMINGNYADGRTSAQNVIHEILRYTNDNVLSKKVGFFWSFIGPQAGPLGGEGSGIVVSTLAPGQQPPSGGFDPTPPSNGTGSLGGWDAGSGGGSTGSTESLGGSFMGPPNSGNTGTLAKGSNNGIYYVAPWEAANALEEIRTISESVPYDIEEFEEWDGDTNNIKKTLKFHHPRMGSVRHDLRFAEGENILQAFTVSTSADDYANAVLVIGAGENSNTIIAYKYLAITNAMRRIHIIDDRSIYNLKTANAIANLELAQRSQAIHVGSIVIDVEHPNAPLNEIRLGDDIKVDAVIPFLGRQVVWHRVTGIQYTPGGASAELSLSRSDSFNYLFSGE